MQVTCNLKLKLYKLPAICQLKLPPPLLDFPPPLLDFPPIRYFLKVSGKTRASVVLSRDFQEIVEAQASRPSASKVKLSSNPGNYQQTPEITSNFANYQQFARSNCAN